jgi:hypothetical protein
MMVKLMKIASIILMSVISGYAYAQLEKKADLPLSCDDSGYNFTDDRLNLANNSSSAIEQRVYLIKNIGSAQIWLNHEIDNVSASAGWATELQPEKWTALMLDKQNFELKCVEIKPGAEQVIPCQAILQICQLQHMQFSKSSKGSYWAAENLAIDEIWDKLEKRGINLNNKRV